MTSPIDAVRRYHDELTAIRRDIHANPELGLEEQRTADLVARMLEEWGIEVHRGVGTTGFGGGGNVNFDAGFSSIDLVALCARLDSNIECNAGGDRIGTYPNLLVHASNSAIWTAFNAAPFKS